MTHTPKIITIYIGILLGVMMSVACTRQSEVASDTRNILNLAGEWCVALDSNDVGINQHWCDSVFTTPITLPGTLDAAGIGYPNTLQPKLEKPQILHLTRKFSYTGPAWYVKEFEIAEAWENKALILNLERVLWNSNVWIDGVHQGELNSLSAQHRYTITGLSAGKHRLTIRIDNRRQFDISVKEMAHAYTNETQVMWNGIIGNIGFELADKVRIGAVKVYPDLEKQGARVDVEVLNATGQPVDGTINLAALLNNSKLDSQIQSFSIDSAAGVVHCFYKLGSDMKLWNEFNSNVYTLNVDLKAGSYSDKSSTTFGMRQITNRDGYLQINGTRIFLRGTLECCIFPLTGHPPMDEAGWREVFTTAKQWGLNHLRFHSWCPPAAAFNVADEMGFYLQIELPLWSLNVGKDAATTHFLEAEAQKIIDEYGNHPSFCLWSMGNELEGDADLLNAWVASLKARDSRHLYMTTTFSFQKGMGAVPQATDDFFVTQWTNNGWIRGQGVFNSEAPSFDKNYSRSLNEITVPVISHEIGQYSVYPDLKEIEKYTGSLIPLNLMAVKEDLNRRGLAGKAEAFLHSSGKLAAILYKEEIERAMKTPEFSGFQLLDLHDFPGQGTALVGLLNAFWESKGIITANEFNAFCSSVVPLVSFPKAIYQNSETFEAIAGIANFTDKTMESSRLKWSLIDNNDQLLAAGTINATSLGIGYNADLGKITVPLQSVKKAQQLKLQLSLEGTSYQNSWNIWVYPSELRINTDEVVVTSDIKTAQQALRNGQKVLFNPQWRQINGIEGKFVPVFWSPVHFPKQAGTMGVLCDPTHPALAGFPTDEYTNWQWWDLNINSTTVVLDSISTVTPIVEMIDNFVSNRRLASVFEAKAGKGLLLFSAIDLTSDIEKRPVAKQLLHSLLNYMNGTSFNPKHEINENELDQLMVTKSDQNSKKGSESIY